MLTTLTLESEIGAPEDARADRRAAHRHAISAAVRLEMNEGYVRNLSTRGLYFVSTKELEAGATVEMDLALPYASPSGVLQCRVTARVLRAELEGEEYGVAAEIESWKMPETDVGC